MKMRTFFPVGYRCQSLKQSLKDRKVEEGSLMLFSGFHSTSARVATSWYWPGNSCFVRVRDAWALCARFVLPIVFGSLLEYYQWVIYDCCIILIVSFEEYYQLECFNCDTDIDCGNMIKGLKSLYLFVWVEERRRIPRRLLQKILDCKMKIPFLEKNHPIWLAFPPTLLCNVRSFLLFPRFAFCFPRPTKAFPNLATRPRNPHRGNSFPC